MFLADENCFYRFCLFILRTFRAILPPTSSCFYLIISNAPLFRSPSTTPISITISLLLTASFIIRWPCDCCLHLYCYSREFTSIKRVLFIIGSFWCLKFRSIFSFTLWLFCFGKVMSFYWKVLSLWGSIYRTILASQHESTLSLFLERVNVPIFIAISSSKIISVLHGQQAAPFILIESLWHYSQ